MEHLGRMRDTLGKAVDHFNRGAASLQSRVIPSARRIKDLGSGTSRDIPAIEPIESSPAPIAIPEPLSANEEEEN
jgi:DNA recombination protein RmuC